MKGRRAVEATAEAAAARARLRDKRGISRFDRRDRRAARSGAFRRTSRPARRGSAPGRFLDAAARDHDHRHLSEGSPRGASGLDGGDVVIDGIAKGSGMIAPDMATMLSFIFTDAPVAPAALQGCLAAAVAEQLQRITVDGDTSTSDTVLAFATGAAAASGVAVARRGEPRASAVSEAACPISAAISRSRSCATGRGSTKFVEVRVTGAASDASAKRIALSIANSPLVKTAHRRRGRQLGPRGDGGRQGRRAGRSRPPVDLVRRASRRRRRRARPGLFGGRGLRLHEEREN